ncbi:MAG: non-homologous end-joining DNA ligase [Jatrophihabitans sp.]
MSAIGQPMPRGVSPMLATRGTVPRARPQEWAYELKWDGVRTICYIDGERLRLQSRTGRDVTESYPDLAELAASLHGLPAVLDGEIVAFDDNGRPSFGRLQRRMNVRDAEQIRLATAEVAVHLLVFDVLWLDGTAAMPLPYAARRELLESLSIDKTRASIPPVFTGDPDAALDFSHQHGLEGVVAKRLDSSYLPGRRSPDWVKTKHLRAQEVVLGGWRPGEGSRSRLGALLMGIPDGEGALTFIGRVGTGLTEPAIDDLLSRFAPAVSIGNPFGSSLPESEMRGARFIRPDLVAEVQFMEWTLDGRLRFPVWRGLRPDKTPDQVRREEG